MSYVKDPDGVYETALSYGGNRVATEFAPAVNNTREPKQLSVRLKTSVNFVSDKWEQPQESIKNYGDHIIHMPLTGLKPAEEKALLEQLAQHGLGPMRVFSKEFMDYSLRLTGAETVRRFLELQGDVEKLLALDLIVNGNWQPAMTEQGRVTNRLPVDGVNEKVLGDLDTILYQEGMSAHVGHSVEFGGRVFRVVDDQSKISFAEFRKSLRDTIEARVSNIGWQKSEYEGSLSYFAPVWEHGVEQFTANLKLLGIDSHTDNQPNSDGSKMIRVSDVLSVTVLESYISDEMVRNTDQKFVLGS